MKIKSKKIRNTKIIVPFDGLIDIDSNGLAEVSERAHDILVENAEEWETASTASDKGKEDVEDSRSEEEKVIAQIKVMTIEELTNLATEADYPKEEWGKFASKPKLLAGYLIKKYNEIKLAEDIENEEDLKEDVKDTTEANETSEEQAGGAESAE